MKSKRLLTGLIILLFINGVLIADDEDDAEAMLSMVAYQDLEGLKGLIAGGADINAEAKDGATALSMAMNQNNAEMVALLKANGAIE